MLWNYFENLQISDLHVSLTNLVMGVMGVIWDGILFISFGFWINLEWEDFVFMCMCDMYIITSLK